MVFSDDFIIMSGNLKFSSRLNRRISSLGKYKVKYKDPSDNKFKVIVVDDYFESDIVNKFKARGLDVVGIDEIVAPTQKDPTSTRGTFEVLAEEKKTGRKTRYKITGPSKEEVIKKLDYSGFKVLSIKAFSANSGKTPGKWKDKTFNGKHYQVNLQDKNGNFFTATGWGDKDKLRKKIENSGYQVVGMKEFSLSPQSKDYNVFRDREIVNLLLRKGVNQDQINDLVKENMRGSSPIDGDDSHSELTDHVISNHVSNEIFLTPYYTRFSSN